MIIEIIFAIISLGIGCFLGWYVTCKTKLLEKFLKTSKEINNIIEDPKLLKKRLEENGRLIDGGQEIKYEIVKMDGKDTLVEKRVPYIKKR